ncbi:Transcription factor IIS [Gracilaria domingensis]|nr:Transcription factor IIS [Gracilaria domingensis]
MTRGVRQSSRDARKNGGTKSAQIRHIFGGRVCGWRSVRERAWSTRGGAFVCATRPQYKNGTRCRSQPFRRPGAFGAAPSLPRTRSASALTARASLLPRRLLSPAAVAAMSNVIEDVFGSDWGSDIELRNEISDAIKNSDDKDAEPEPSLSTKPSSSTTPSQREKTPSAPVDSDSPPSDAKPSKHFSPDNSDSERRPSSARRRPTSKRSSSPVPNRRSAGRRSDEDNASDVQSEAASSGDDRDGERRRRREKKRRLKQGSSRNTKRVKRERRSSPELEGDSEDDVPTERRRRRRSSAAKQVEEEPVEEPEPKPEKPKTEFERVMDDAKAYRRPRAKELDDNIVRTQCLDFLEKMMTARDDDVKAFRNGQPALSKLRMLREVELMLMKTSHREMLLDSMLLNVMKAWLDPLPDGTLPNVAIRKSLLQILSDMPVDNDWIDRLESSQGLGKLIHFLATKDSNPTIRRVAEKLMMKWARVVYRNKANFHDLLEEYARPDDGNRIPTEGVAAERRHALNSLRSFKSTRQKLESIKPYPGKERSQVLAAIPRPSPMLYTTLAESETVVSQRSMRGGRGGKGTSRKVSKTISDLRRNNKRASARASRPSINGRDR